MYSEDLPVAVGGFTLFGVTLSLGYAALIAAVTIAALIVTVRIVTTRLR